jgi:hypothetical protein
LWINVSYAGYFIVCAKSAGTFSKGDPNRFLSMRTNISSSSIEDKFIEMVSKPQIMPEGKLKLLINLFKSVDNTHLFFSLPLRVRFSGSFQGWLTPW